jgi:hypothetical protein
VKNILDEIRPEDMVMIPGEKWQRGREQKYVLQYGGHRGIKDRVQWTADSVQLLVAKIVMGNGSEEEQKKKQAHYPIMERPAIFHKAIS